MLSVATLLAGCGTNYNNDYLMAKQTQSTKTPAHLSDYARQTLYPVPDGAVWHSNEPVSIYPPGSALADKGNKHPTAAIVSLGIDAQGSSALEVTKPYNDVWQQLPKNLQTAGFTVLHNDPDIGLYVASKAKTNYQFTVMSATQGDSVISVRDGQGALLSDTESNQIMTLLETQLRKMWP